MAGSKWTGPLVSLGALAGAASGSQPYEYSPELGASLLYQGIGLPDVRYPINKDNPTVGSIYAHLVAAKVPVLDFIPAASALALTSGGNATSGTPLVNIVANAAGASLNIPYLTIGNNSVPAGVGICLDMGFSTLACTSGNPVVIPPTVAGRVQTFLYDQGDWVIIEAVGNAGATLPLIAQVLAVTPDVSVTLSLAPLATNATARVGSTNQLNLNAYGNPAALAHVPRVGAGLAAFLDPRQSGARCVGVTGVASGTGGAVLIRSIDLYGNPQTETITATAGATTVYGTKAVKWFLSATPQFTDAHGYTVVTSDTFGFPIRSDEWEQVEAFFNGTLLVTAAVSTTSAWTAADQTTPALATTTDPRGTLQVSSRGANATVTAANFTNGARRLAVFQNISIPNMVEGDPTFPAAIYGVTPA